MGSPARVGGLQGELLAQGSGLRHTGFLRSPSCARGVSAAWIRAGWSEQGECFLRGREGVPPPALLYLVDLTVCGGFLSCAVEQEGSGKVPVAMAKHHCAPEKPKTHPREGGCYSLGVGTGHKCSWHSCGSVLHGSGL